MNPTKDFRMQGEHRYRGENFTHYDKDDCYPGNRIISSAEPSATDEAKGRTITIPAYNTFHEAIEDGTVVVVEDSDSHHTRLRARRAFYFLPLKSAYSDGEVIPFSQLETGTGKAYREAKERLAFIQLLADLTKCRTCGIYDCTQHGTPTAKELLV